MRSLETFAAEKLAAMEARHLRRELVDTAREDGIWMVRGGKTLLSFSCNDYLNFTQHPRLKEAAIAAIQEFGVGAGASRLVTGNHPLFSRLEARLAKLKDTEAACVFGSGYLANTGIIPTFVGRNDLILVDELAHACIRTGAQVSGAKTLSFRHNDLEHLTELLESHRNNHKHALIATDGVFSMDGDLAPLPQLGDIAEQFDAWLLSDDAHGIGVVGGGRGSTFAHARRANVPLQMGTLSKAIGGYGGYICASAAVIDLIKTRARTLIYSTGLPPANVAAALSALDIIENEPDYAALPLQKAQAFTKRAGLPEAVSPVVPLVIGKSDNALAASQALEDEGYLVTAIRPPTVAQGTARLRITFTAAHPDADIERLADIVRERFCSGQS
jgi:8-amino-7-oxononanoate synthase